MVVVLLVKDHGVLMVYNGRPFTDRTVLIGALLERESSMAALVWVDIQHDESLFMHD